MNLLITSPSANPEVNLSLHLCNRIWEISLKVARIFFACGRRWPGMLSELEIYSQYIGHYVMETVECRSVVVCVGCDLWQEKTNTVVPMSVHWPFCHGASTSDGTHWDGQMFQSPSQYTPILSSWTQLWHWVCVLKEKNSLWCLEQIWHRSHWSWYVYAGFTLLLPRMALGPFGSR